MAGNSSYRMQHIQSLRDRNILPTPSYLSTTAKRVTNVTPSQTLPNSAQTASKSTGGTTIPNNAIERAVALAEANTAFNASEAQKNRDWQERMSNTAHQREVADLMAAGLNPILSVTGGNGASVGSGGQATADSSGTSAMSGIVGSMLSSNAMLAAAQLANSATRYSADVGYKGAKVSAFGSLLNAVSNLVPPLSTAKRVSGFR